VIQVNPTTFSHFHRLKDTFDPDAFCIQETMRADNMLDDAVRHANANGHHAAMNASKRTPAGGLSAGVAVTSRWQFSLNHVDCPSLQPPCPHRFVCRTWHAVLRHGVLLASVYLLDSGRLCQFNIDLLDEVGRYLTCLGIPFIVGGDWQVHPQVLERSGWPAAISASVVCSGQNTYKAGQAETEMDYFLVSNVLRSSGAVVSCQALECDFVHKHSPVQLTISGRCRKDTCLTIRKPRPIPVVRAIGCPRPPIAWDHAAVLAGDITDVGSLSRAYGSFAMLAEQEVLDAVGLDPDNAGARAVAPKVARVSIFAVTNGKVASTAQARTWRHLQDIMVRLIGLVNAGRSFLARNLLRKALKFCPCNGRPLEWPQWRREVRGLKPLLSHTYASPLDNLQLHNLVDKASQIEEWLGSMALTVEDKSAADRSLHWKTWCKQEDGKPGAPGLHRFISRKDTWASFCVEADNTDVQVGQLGACTTSPQTDVLCRAQPWHLQWAVEMQQQDLQWPAFSQEELDMLVLPTYAQFIMLCMTFKSTTGIGCCGFHPRHFAFLSEEAYAILALIWLAMLRLGLTPQQIDLLIILLIPKEAGGDRPIGLFPTAIRVLNRWLRRTYGEAWRKKNSREYLFGTRGKGTTVANWIMAAGAEYARATSKHAAAGLFDLVKAFEHIEHERLKQQAAHYGFSLPLLRYLIRLYTMPRRIRVGQLVADQVQATRTVVPGDAFADLLMFLSVVRIIDLMQATWEALWVAVVVDDVQILAVGGDGEVVSSVAGASAFLRAEMKQAGLVVATDPAKWSILTSSDDIAARINTRLGIKPARGRAKGSKVIKTSARNLGVDYTLRSRRTVSVQKLRLKRGAHKAGRLARVKAAGVSVKTMVSVAKAGINSVQLYGSGITGMSDTAIAAARTTVHKALVRKPHGRSATIDMEIDADDLDPAYAATLNPLAMWVMAAWFNWVPRQYMVRIMMAALIKARTCKTLWSAASGPAMVVLASLDRIGWKVSSAFKWVMKNGVELDLLGTSAHDILKLAKADVREWLWSGAADKHTAYATLNGAPYIQPIKALMALQPGPDWNHGHKGMLKAIMADAMWSNGNCTLCGQPWSMWHDHWGCDAVGPFRRQYGLPPAVVACAHRGHHVPLFTHAILPDPAPSFPLPVMEEQILWGHGPRQRTTDFGNEAFGDGSGLNANYFKTARCGWGVVAVSREGASRFAGLTASGPLVGMVQDVPAAELTALLVFLRHCMPGADGKVTFYTDCKWLIETFAKGEWAATHPMACHSHLWRSVFRHLKDLGDDRGDDVLVLVKVQAHASYVYCGNDEVLLFQKWGNDLADGLAKAGAAIHEGDDAAIARLNRSNYILPMIARFLARNGVWRREHFGAACIPGPMAPTGRGDRAVDPHHTLHRICNDPCTLRTRCLRCNATAISPAVLCKHPCDPPDGCKVHKVWRLNEFVFCIDCGAYSSQRAIGLKGNCGGIPKSSSALNRRDYLINGLHPTTRLSIGRPQPCGLIDDWHTGIDGLIGADE